MDNINFTSFKAFVMTQDESKPINHYSWETCSVGDYLRHTGVDTPIGMYINDVAFTLCDNNEELSDMLGGDSAYLLRTYKELQLLLTNYEEGMI